MTLSFEQAHAAFLQSHLNRRSGERKGRLEQGHGHGEVLFLKQVWWPLYGSFEHLHPEYEVLDWRGRPYFGDFAYLPGYLKLIIEIKGFAAHVQEMDRKKYSNELNRELFLQTLGYRVASFSYDDVERRPELCRNLLQTLINRYRAGDQPAERPKFAEMEVIRYAMGSVQPITTTEIARHFCIDNRTAIKILRSLCSKSWLKPIPSGLGQRIHYYELIRDRWEMIDF